MARRFSDHVERRLHQLFDLSLFFKGLFAAAEFLLGAGLLLVKGQWLTDWAQYLAARAVISDPDNPLFLGLWHGAQNTSPHAVHFWGVYLLIHGVVKLAVVAGLALEILWAYPASILVLIAFIVYQIERFTHTHSIVLIGLTLFDLVVIWLAWHEYQMMRMKRREGR